MIKTTSLRRPLLLVMAILLILGQLNFSSFRVFAEENDNDSVSYTVQNELSSDKKKATLTLKATPKNTQVKILAIETPDGEKTEGEEAEYVATKNGSVDFIISYKDKAGAEKEYTASYKVSEISEETATVTPGKTGLKSSAPTVALNIPDYNKTAWGNGDIKDVSVTVEFNNNSSAGKKINFTLPDGMRFVSLPVPSSYQPTSSSDSSILSYFGAGNPVGDSITSVTVPDKEAGYNKATYGTVSYELEPATEKLTLSFSVQVDAAKYYGTADLKSPIKVDAYMGEGSMPVASAEQSVHAEGKNVVGYASQKSVQTMFRNWYTSSFLPEVMASTDTEDSYNYTKPYSVVNGINQTDSRGSRIFVPKNVTTTLYYPEGMEYAGVVNEGKSVLGNTDNRTITHYPSENKVVIDFKQENYYGVVETIFAVKYKVPAGTPVGTYTAPKVPHAVITTYDDQVFETDALTNDSNDTTTLAAKDTCKVVGGTANKMVMLPRNYYINPDNETWAGLIQINNKQTAGVKTNQVYQIKFDENWEAYTVNLPFDGKLAGNKATDVQYKTNLNPEYRTYEGTLPKTNANKMLTLEATAVGLQEGEYFTEVKANVGDFSTGFTNIDTSAPFKAANSASYGIVKPGITSIQFDVNIWGAEDEENTKVSGSSTYTVTTGVSTAANGTASFYNSEGALIKTARAGDTVTTKASLIMHDYPYGTRTVLNNPEIYLRQLEGTTVKPGSIKLTDQDGKEVDFSVEAKSANNGDKVYVIKTTDVTVGEYIGYPAKKQYLNISYNTTFDMTLSKSIHTDIQELLAWGGSNVTSALGANVFPDNGLDVNQNGKDAERLLSTNTSTLSVPKQDTVTVETFLNVAGEGIKAAYVEDDDSTVSYFTPGTDADYMVKITNTSSGSAESLDIYIPIPKTGQDFGSKFQSEPFKWDMKLSDALAMTDAQKAQFDISYTTEATSNNYTTDGIYSNTLADYGKANMVRIKVKTEIESGETQTIKVPLKVDETFDSATAGNKIGERDVYNPYYAVTTNTYSGSIAGTRVGAELVIVEVAGRLFKDKNANGVYESAQSDTPLANETVELYKWNETNSTYEPFTKDGQNVTTTTDANGDYKFDYNLGIGYGKYAVKFPDKEGHKFTLQNVGKDKSLNSATPNLGAETGWVKEIDPAQPDAQHINAGYISYVPETDLKVNLNEKIVQEGKSLKITLPKVAQTNGEAAEDTIEPDFFQKIQATTDGYKWTTANAGIATAKTLSDGSGAIVGVSTNGKTMAATDLTIAVKDIFGTEQKSTAPIYVTATSGNTAQKDQLRIGATNFTLEYKDALALTEAQAVTKAKTAAFEEVKNGVNSNAQDRTNVVKVDETQLKAIQNGPNQGGTYPLTYTLEQDGKEVEVVIQVKVEKDLTIVNAHDSKIYVGDSWRAADNFDSALNKEGEAVAFADIVVTGSVDTTTAGTYPVSYKYNDMVTTINVTVKDNATEVNAHDSTIYTGDTWSAKDNFDSAADKDGNPITFDKITVTNTVNTTQAGTYPITYTYAGEAKTITVTVKENKKGINAHNATIYVGDSWTAEDNFDNAVDKDGDPVAFSEVSVTETPAVNTNKAGTYQIKYSFDGATKTVTLTVKNIQTAVNAHNSTIYIDEPWDAKDNFDSARDKDGNAVTFADITVEGTVDNTQAGTYPITYKYDGFSKTIQVSVKNPQTAIYAHDSVVYTGDTWTAKDNFDRAIDKAGNAVAYKDITVEDAADVDLATPGTYSVTYRYAGVSKVVQITVKPRQTKVESHDSTIYAGDDWQAKDNFDTATNKQGDNVKLANVTVTGQVDTQTPGTYEITYSYDGVTSVSHVTVLQNHAKIIVHDSQLQLNGKWDPKDNFVSAMSRNGTEIPLSNVKVKGKVNTKKAGTYKVTYTIDPNEGTADAGKKELSVVANIRVVEKEVISKGGNDLAEVKQRTATFREAIPRTGDQMNLWIVLLGACLVGLALFLWINRQRRNHK
ncbi:DUF5011 domain-containing protein [Listeria sp. FSL L7-0253]|uniref:bacterial Ig-like domain-containing protein n=1 Tax=Listeria cossartiae TaxID=2838249 RepID=UPI0016292420|nr:bacterial Ig-like domain-containing protein [Listeria cossartiae]MBC2186162.1 DUF5011 domain-containing protein [Listeria cossartiae subsp. cossartiae]